MVITAANAASLLEPGLREIFDTAVSRPMQVMSTLFRGVDSTKKTEHYQGMGANGLVPPFNGTVPYEDTALGYKLDLLNVDFALGMTVEQTLIDDDMYNEINQRAMDLGDAFPTTIEQDAVNVFINGFTDGGTNRIGQSTNGPDAVGLMSTAHPHSPSNTGSTQSNEDTLTLTLANLDTSAQRMQNFTDDKDKLLAITPDLLLIPSELERTATQIVSDRALYEPGSAQFDVNMFAGKIRPMVWNRLTDATAWFLIDTAVMRRHLIWQWRQRPVFAQQQDFDGIQAKFRGYMRYSIGWRDWRWIYGNNPV